MTLSSCVGYQGIHQVSPIETSRQCRTQKQDRRGKADYGEIKTNLLLVRRFTEAAHGVNRDMGRVCNGVPIDSG